jgi:chromate transporter
VSLLALALTFAWLSLIALGGGAAVLPEMLRICEERGWVDAKQFAHFYNLGQMSPGPPTLMVVLIGYKVQGLAGGLAVLAAFVLPAAGLALSLGRAYGQRHETPAQKRFKRALAPIAVGLVAASLDMLARQNLTSGTAGLVCLACAGLLFLPRAHPGAVVLVAGLLGPLLFPAP